MRILKIELQNINSLKSHSPIVIDFESEVFKDVGLYAITGATGAGKTTIMDAITIALYHSVPRFNSTTAKANLMDVVSYGANEAMARVCFENQGKRYEAHWSMRLTTKAGKPLTTPKEEVRLKNLSSGRIIAEKKMELKAEVERITQLNYQQFLRSAMLAQGEFAAFLSASSQDKGKLLEQITGEDIYKKIGETIGGKIGEEKRKLEEIRAKINAEDLLSEAQSQELKAEQEELKKKLDALSAELKTVERIVSWYKKKTELLKEQEHLAQQKVLLEEQKLRNESIINSLKQHEKAEPHKDLLDTIKRYEKEQHNNTARLKELEEAFKILDFKIADAKDQELKHQTAHLQSESEFNRWLPTLDQVAKHDADITHTREKKSTTQKTFEEYKRQSSQLHTALVALQKTQDEEIKKRAAVEAFLVEQKNCLAVESHINNWRSQLLFRQKNHEKIQADTKDLSEQIKQLTLTEGVLKETSAQLGLQQIKLENLDDALKKTTLALESHPIAGLLTQREQAEQQISTNKEALRLSREFKKLTQDEKRLSALQKELADESTILQGQDKDLQAKKKSAESAVADAEIILTLESKIIAFDAERKKLTENSPCPLCGSAEHPYVSQYENASLSKNQTQLEERKKALDILTKEEKHLASAQMANKTKAESNAQQLKTVNEQLTAHTANFTTLKINIPIEASEAIANFLSDLQKQSATLSQKITEGQGLQKAKDQQDEAFKTQNTLVNELKTKQATLTEKRDNIDRQVKQMQSAIAKINLETEDLESQLRDDLALYQLALPTVEKSSAFVRTIDQRIAMYHAKEKEQAELKNQIDQCAKDITHHQEQRDEKQKNSRALENELKETDTILQEVKAKRSALLPMEMSIQEKREQLQKSSEAAKKTLDHATQLLQTLKTEHVSKTKETENIKKEDTLLISILTETSARFENAIATSDFASRSAVEEALLSLEEKKRQGAIVKEIENKNIELKTIETRLSRDFEKLEQEKAPEYSADEIQKKQQNIEEQKNKLTERTGEIRQKFELDRQIKARNYAVTQEILSQEKVLKKWVDLMTLLGGSKHAFNTYVQRLTLHNLIQLANVHLFKLNKRYSLRLDATYKPGEELFFKLIDHYQTDEARYVDTSSGGEKFLISLALALGLSDLASNNVSIDSLFIDEGFGTLDSHTLETVISSLETLQAQGKMIGIISHVENLKKRIPTQIRVLKKSNGVSEVEIL